MFSPEPWAPGPGGRGVEVFGMGGTHLIGMRTWNPGARTRGSGPGARPLPLPLFPLAPPPSPSTIPSSHFPFLSPPSPSPLSPLVRQRAGRTVESMFPFGVWLQISKTLQFLVSTKTVPWQTVLSHLCIKFGVHIRDTHIM